ncbi:MAG: hypothetical protein LQ347_004381, partial [Umbilicaria vellea]
MNFSKAYGDFILGNTPNYIQHRPLKYPSNLPWPSTSDIVDNLAEMSKLNWPLSPFVSPILFPDMSTTLPSTLLTIAPITSSAHPSIHSLSCALLHPSDPSCLRTYITFYLTAFPALAKFFTLIFGLFALPQYRKFLAVPFTALNSLAKRILRMTLFVTGAIGTAWGSICFFQYLLPRTLLPTQRWFWGGFVAGLWAFVDRRAGRGNVMASVRLSVDSLWKVG